MCDVLEGLKILNVPTLWSAIGAVGSLVAAGGVIYVAAQFKFVVWTRAQEIFMETRFMKAREKILEQFGFKGVMPSKIKQDDKDDAKLVCRRMDQLARLKKFVGHNIILETWGYPLGKSWMILKQTVAEERELHPGKWDAFERLGEAAVQKLNLEGLNKKAAARAAGKAKKVEAPNP